MKKYEDSNVSANNFDQCTKCTICTVYCPMLEVNPLYPGPKQSGPDGERYRLKEPKYYDMGLKYCLNCKRCEVACPSGVRIGDIIALAKAKNGRKVPKLRDVMLANTDFVGSVATVVAPVVNTTLGLRPVKRVMDATMAIDHRRTFPKYASEKFTTWFRRNMAESQKEFAKQVCYFHGCYANYNYPQLGKDLVKVLNAVGYGVRLMEGERCCGVAKIASGLIGDATRDARRNLSEMRKAVAEGMEIVATSSSCTFTLRDEYDHVLGLENGDVRDSVSLATRFLFRLVESGEIRLAFREDFRMRAAYHSACHIEKLGWGIYSTSLLKMIPGMELIMLPSQCCGIAGTFGFKKENYDYSQAIGRPLFDRIEELGVEIVATDCETCKWQIEMSTSAKVLNPISILAEAIDVEKTRELNNVIDL
ncbi:MAG: anaerobic glycerol-3-phosphate dehydrogenase subunit C [Tidjanibacter sp.]|nr:anaerobic glycerol-3-phosphate dehydrogenase subunit C [Tidjanibacter sp.]